MLHEQMPERWYELLRERIQVEEQRMGLIKDCAIENDRHEKLLTQAQNLDREMLLVIRQAIADFGHSTRATR
jgi:uncharacterized protein YigA (DUF484 family)